jgi:hypothetical protein
MVYSFERRWKPEWDSSLVDLKINRNDLVTMASIVEREARLPEERPVIAAVYYNRLRKGMLLQADPTIQYALGHHVGRVLYKDLEIASPYNTYIHKGLPPGPVASPGVASLAAAANPANVPYLYFVASKDGHHEFRMTLEEHTSAIREVRATSPARKPAPRMLAMASTGTASANPATRSGASTSRPTSKAAGKITSKPSPKSATKTPARNVSKTVSKTGGTTVKATSKKSTDRSSSTKKRSASRTTTSSR